MILGLTMQFGYTPLMTGVIASLGSPVKGAIIIATSSGGNGYNATTLDGKYVINQGLTTGTYNVSVSAEGYISKEVGGVSVNVGNETKNIDFSLKHSGGISGKITDSTTGAGIANVVVIAYSNGRYGWFSQTDSSGNYKIMTNLESGIYNITVTAATGYFTKTVSGISVTASVETTGVNIFLNPSAVISGMVRTPSGDPVPNVSVTALSSDSGNYQGFATTGVDGSYRIDSGLGAGTYMVTASSGAISYQVPNVVATVGQETTNVILTLNVTVQPSGAISGLITDTDNNPITGATILAGSGHDTSDSQGRFVISDVLPSGNYTVYVSASGYQSQDRIGVSVTTGKTTSDINLKLVKIPAAQSGRISGTVTSEDNPLPNEQPSSITCITSQASINVGDTLTVSGEITPAVVGASVKIEYKSGSTDVSRSATTGSDGKFNDKYAPTLVGSWTVQASWGGNTQYFGASSSIVMFTVSQPSITTGGIKVTVLDSGGKTIAGASVSSTITPSGQAALSGVSGSDGSLTFNGVAAGSYTLQASMSGYVTNSGSATVASGNVVTSSITLQTQSTGGTPSGGVPGYTYEGSWQVST